MTTVPWPKAIIFWLHHFTNASLASISNPGLTQVSWLSRPIAVEKKYKNKKKTPSQIK